MPDFLVCPVLPSSISAARAGQTLGTVADNKGNRTPGDVLWLVVQALLWIVAGCHDGMGAVADVQDSAVTRGSGQTLRGHD